MVYLVLGIFSIFDSAFGMWDDAFDINFPNISPIWIQCERLKINKMQYFVRKSGNPQGFWGVSSSHLVQFLSELIKVWKDATGHHSNRDTKENVPFLVFLLLLYNIVLMGKSFKIKSKQHCLGRKLFKVNNLDIHLCVKRYIWHH